MTKPIDWLPLFARPSSWLSCEALRMLYQLLFSPLLVRLLRMANHMGKSSTSRFPPTTLGVAGLMSLRMKDWLKPLSPVKTSWNENTSRCEPSRFVRFDWRYTARSTSAGMFTWFGLYG